MALENPGMGVVAVRQGLIMKQMLHLAHLPTNAIVEKSRSVHELRTTLGQLQDYNSLKKQHQMAKTFGGVLAKGLSGLRALVNGLSGEHPLGWSHQAMQSYCVIELPLLMVCCMQESNG